ncbi:hypothetical protein M0R72_06565 [Candidatus Pacearchaeota archaeon]|jgi:hypothetical protein|nr:hypothetical protein [Candidatus Pacearchaeota archaeon]
MIEEIRKRNEEHKTLHDKLVSAMGINYDYPQLVIDIDVLLAIIDRVREELPVEKMCDFCGVSTIGGNPHDILDDIRAILNEEDTK